MNRLYRSLAGLLEQKVSLYDEFISLLRREWDAIARFSRDNLQEILNKKETLALKLQVLDEQRESLIGELAEQLHLRVADLTLKKLVEGGNKADPVFARLATYRTRLLDQIRTIKELNENNGVFINRSSLSLKRSMAFIHRSDEEQLASYQPNGSMHAAVSQGRLLNTDI
jgi:flagellar biosynthesis/type III secretory pathway chaperone